MTLTKDQKQVVIDEFHRHDSDTGSPEVQVAILTRRIEQLTEHLKANKHDESSRRGLLKLVGQRRRHLAYLKGRDAQAYLALTDRLGIRRKYGAGPAEQLRSKGSRNVPGSRNQGRELEHVRQRQAAGG